MIKTAESPPDRIMILGRHGRTPSNEARLSGASDARVQGFNPHMEMSNEGIIRAAAFGFPLGRLAAEHGLVIVGGSTSQADRAQYTSQLSQHISSLRIPENSPDSRLNELRKGNLEGILRSEAYPNGEAAYKEDWHLRHGSGETAWEASERWLQWFTETTGQPWPPVDNAEGIPTWISTGHNLVTSYGLWRLMHPGHNLDSLPSLRETEAYKMDDASAIILAERDGQWSMLPERVAPTAEDIATARLLHQSGHLPPFQPPRE